MKNSSSVSPTDPSNWLEKIGIVQTLGKIEKDVAVMAVRMENLEKRREEMHAEIKETFDKHSEALYGSGEDGLIRAIDRLNQDKKNRMVHLSLIYGAIVVEGVHIAFEHFTK